MASFSEDRMYRYGLIRIWDERREKVCFIGLNPSTADETIDDPTIRRCVDYAKAWGYGGLVMGNLFAVCATKPVDMRRAEKPVGPENDAWLFRHSQECVMVVAAWGCCGNHLNRAAEVRRIIPHLHYLKLTKNGHPGHPLYLPKTLMPVPWEVK